MSDISVFTEKAIEPAQQQLAEKLADTYELWLKVIDIVLKQYPTGVQEWNYPGKNYGWSFRIKDKKRAVLYLLPREGFFKVAFVFGQKATDTIMETDVSPVIKNDLANARKYAEGRGVNFEIRNEEPLNDVTKLVEIKLRY